MGELTAHISLDGTVSQPEENSDPWEQRRKKISGLTTTLMQCFTQRDQMLRYVYDYGQSTSANIRYHGIRVFKSVSEVPKTGVVLLRNEPLKIPCTNCSKQAKYITAGLNISYFPVEDVFCSKECAVNPRGDSLCHIVNSPRCGCRGFQWYCDIESEDGEGSD